MLRTAVIAAAMTLMQPLHAEIVDRIAVSVGDQIITLSDIRLALRVAGFLDGEQPVFTPQARRQMAGRLVEQALLRQEMNLSRFPTPDAKDVDSMLASVKQQRFSGDAAYRAALVRDGITEAELKRQLQWQIRLLRFVDFRFTPALLLSSKDLREYYDKEFLPRWKAKTSAPPPTLEQSRAEIERDVNAKKANDALERWLKFSRERARIVYHEEAFQ